MSADDLNNQKTRDGNTADDNVENTPATNVTAVNVNTTAFEEVQKMFSTFENKSAERDKVMSSLAKQVKNLTARTRAVLPCGTTRVRGRRFNYATPSDRSGNVQGKTSGQNPDEITPTPTWKNQGDLPPSWKTKRKEKSGTSMWILAVSPNLRMKTQTCIRVVQGAVWLKTIPSSITPRPKKTKLPSWTNRKNWPRSKLGKR